MGFYFGMYAFSANKKYLILSLRIPFFLHGFYNFFGYPINKAIGSASAIGFIIFYPFLFPIKSLLGTHNI